MLLECLENLAETAAADSGCKICVRECLVSLSTLVLGIL